MPTAFGAMAMGSVAGLRLNGSRCARAGPARFPVGGGSRIACSPAAPRPARHAVVVGPGVGGGGLLGGRGLLAVCKRSTPPALRRRGGAPCRASASGAGDVSFDAVVSAKEGDGGAGGLERWLRATRLGKAMRAQVRQLDGLWSQLLPMSLLFFLMAFNNTLLDTIKDTLVVTAAGGGVEQIPFLTVFAVFPASVLFLVSYTLLSSRFSRQRMFDICVISLLSFFALFTWVLFPYQEALTPTVFADRLARALPTGMYGFVGMIRNWTYTLFYCFAELWGDVVLSLLFWGLANENTGLEDAPLLYPLFGVGANVAQTIAGRLLKTLNTGGDGGAAAQAAWGSKLGHLMTIVLGVGVVILATHRVIMDKAAREDWSHDRSCSVIDHEVEAAIESKIPPKLPAAAQPAGEAMLYRETDLRREALPQRAQLQVEGAGGAKVEGGGEGQGEKLSLGEAARFLFQAPAVRFLAIMGLAQGVSTNILEIAWKAQLRILHPTPSAYAGFMGDVATFTGIVTLVMMFISPVLFVRLGWAGAAAATPRILQAGGVVFFGTSVVISLLNMGDLLSLAALKLVVLMGSALYIFSRAAKFSLFKPAEEMVYIGLDEESRTKGKAAVDVVASQAGKSGGSILQQALLVIFRGNLAAAVPVMAGMFFFVLSSWTGAVGKLSMLVFGEGFGKADGDHVQSEEGRGCAEVGNNAIA